MTTERPWLSGILPIVVACVGVLGAILILQGQENSANGYVILTGDAGSRVPVGAALFSYRNPAGTLVSEAGVGATRLVRRGRMIVDESGTKTTVALVNPSSQTAAVTLILRDAVGAESPRQQLPLRPGEGVARYVSELFSPPADFTGSLTFISDVPLAAITLRESKNVHGENLYTTLPIVDDEAPPSAGGVVFPQIAAGEGYATQLILINNSTETLRGQVNLFSPDGRALFVRREGNTVSEFPYEIRSQGIFKANLDNVSAVAVGYAEVTPQPGTGTPAGTAIYQIKSGGHVVTEAGIAATPATTAARMFVDYIGAQTGIAIVNPGNLPADVTLRLIDRHGMPETTAVRRSLPGRNHLAKLVHELFPAIEDGYTGLLEIQSTRPIVPLALKITVNTRSDTVLTTLPVADLDGGESGTSLVFPHIAVGHGFTTRLLIMNPSTTATATGRLTIHRPDGSDLALPMEGATVSQASYRMAQGGSRQFYPGNTDAVASVSLVEPLSNRIVRQVDINEGNTVRPRLRILDSRGTPRHDFDAVVQSLDTDVAEVDEFGGIRGKQKGFSTLTIRVGSHVITATANVTSVGSSAVAYEAIGVAQDQRRGLYLASTLDHTILHAPDLKERPNLYAGIRRTKGYRNELRLDSLFNSPSFIALNLFDGSVYVSDGANHVIRRVRFSGRVETVAGTAEVAGSRNGSALEAAFNNPQGVGLDDDGYLWVADSGNHTIRRINLVTGQVETIAGLAGVTDSTDGPGGQARFRSPSGIAVETESTAQQVDRESTGAPPPPVSVIVADTGNGLVRRVRNAGGSWQVETILSTNIVPVIAAPGKASIAEAAATAGPARFDAPVGVAVDPAGNIFVSEPGRGQLKTILSTGEVVGAAQALTFENPKGIAIAENGRVVVAGDGGTALREIVYGQPQIAAINPDPVTSRGGQSITVMGSNFAPETVVIAAGVLISNAVIRDTKTITFTAPALASGRGTLTVQNRGGLAHKAFVVNAVPLGELAPGEITTVAGGSTFAGEGGPATMASMNPLGIALDSTGNLFIADKANNRVRRVDGRSGVITTVAGKGDPGVLGDKGPAIIASLDSPTAVAFDRSGNLLILTDDGIRKVDATTGIITTIVGGGYGFCGDGGNPLDACFNYITGFTVDAEGNLFIADRYNERVRRVDAKTNTIATIAGNGQRGSSGDNGLATAASLDWPYAVAVDNEQKLLYIAQGGNSVVRQVNLTTNVITTVVDTGAGLSTPTSLVLDAAGNLFMADRDNRRIRKLDVVTKNLTIVAGSGYADYAGDGILATAAALRSPRSLAIDAAGNLFISDDQDFVVRRVDVATGRITTVAGNREAAVVEDNVLAAAATLRHPVGITVDAAGNLFITDQENARIRKVDAATRTIKTIAGGGFPPDGVGDNLLATNAHLGGPRGRVAVDEAGNVYIADRYNYRIRKVDATNTITTVARDVYPDSLALDRFGNLYIAEGEQRRVRKLNLSSGTITIAAGGGNPFVGIDDNRPATEAVFGSQIGIAFDSAGNLFVADTENRRVRKIDVESQFIATVAGGGSRFTENQQATSVSLLPAAVDVDAAGNLFIADFGGPLSIRRVSAATGRITTVAGGGKFAVLGDNGPAIKAFLYYPLGLAVDLHGNVFIADTHNQRIRVIRGPIP